MIKQKQTSTTYTNNTPYTPPTKKITNWSAYDKALTKRGDVSVLLNIALLGSTPEQTGTAGHPLIYSDAVILLLAQLRELFRLPLRQTIGLARSICDLAGLTLQLPKRSTLCRRLAKLTIPHRLWGVNDASLPLIFLPDSTGLKVSGEGEWKVKKHGAERRRAWVKVHLGIIHGSQDIAASLMTEPTVHDGTALPALLDQLPATMQPDEIIGDGAYGGNALYADAKRRGAKLLVPPPKNALWHGDIENGELVDEPGWEVRNGYIRDRRRLGDAEWKRQTGYHRRSLAETAMFRLKNTFGGNLRSRTRANQAAEVHVRVSLLNMFTSYGLPEYGVR